MSKSVARFVSGILVGALLTTIGFALFQRSQQAGHDSQSQTVLKLGHGLDMGHPVHQAMIAALMLITYVPRISLWLPVQTKQLKQVDVDNATFMNAPEAC